MAIREAIILAGGLGTRLRDAVPDLPKCMAPVANRPFLFYVINYLRSQGIERFIFSLGYKHEVIEDYLKDQFPTLEYDTAIEQEPLGTGGAIRLSCTKTKDKTVIVANGDTLFKIDVTKLASFHDMCGAHCTLSLKPMKQFDRYGVVELNTDYSIKNFSEKQYYEEGFINGGVYALNAPKFLGENLPSKFSFEKDYLEKLYDQRRMYGVVQDEYFIDIGIPEDYERSQKELTSEALDISKIDKSWTLFLDRDGVINHEKDNDYILNWGEFRFYDEVKEAMNIFAQKFGKILIVSNQRGVGRGRMTEEDLTNIHHAMKSEIESSGGRIDKIYYCTGIDNIHPYRKPNPGMALQAKRDFPAIDLTRSIIAGNKLSDMKFGRNAGMHTLYIASTHPDQAIPHPDIDLAHPSLISFARSL